MDSETSLAGGSAIFALVAAYFLFLGFSAETTINFEGQIVANAQLMHIQATNILTGIGAAVVSAVLAAGSAIVGAIRRASAPSE